MKNRSRRNLLTSLKTEAMAGNQNPDQIYLVGVRQGDSGSKLLPLVGDSPLLGRLGFIPKERIPRTVESCLQREKRRQTQVPLGRFNPLNVAQIQPCQFRKFTLGQATCVSELSDTDSELFQLPFFCSLRPHAPIRLGTMLD